MSDGNKLRMTGVCRERRIKKMSRAAAMKYALVILVLSAGCSVISPGTVSDTAVSFTIDIDAGMFSAERPVRFIFWDANQLEIAQRNANCSVSYNAETETEDVHCPEGVVYEPVTPIEFALSPDEIGDRVVLTPGNIFVGERYRLQIAGLSSDNCNTTAASIEDVARKATVVVEDLTWMTTEMACQEPPGQ
jgi:hypothetical protein